MENIKSKLEIPKNEPVLNFRPKDPDTLRLKEQISKFESNEVDIPLIINGKQIRTGKTGLCRSPHNLKQKLGIYHQAGPKEIKMAIEGSQKAFCDWSTLPFETRASVFLKAAELLSTKYRHILNAATMLGQSKTCHQAEIDATCELIDFWRFNAYFQEQLYSMQPFSAPGMRNRMEYRPLEGFVFAVTPFNFASIAGNLPSAPALMGNVALWKPASTAVYSAYFTMKLFEEAGLPPGVIQFIPGHGKSIGEMVLKDEKLAGIHFTGSTSTFQNMWKMVGNNIHTYKSYPRIVGETGGKNFMVAHASADLEAINANIVRGAFEYQGQKCSALSRAYIPKGIWNRLKDRLLGEIQTIKMGDTSDFNNFMGAVIDKSSFDKIRGYIDGAKKDADVEIVMGGACDDKSGYFIEPTVLVAKSPTYRTMCEEIFGPVLTIYVYEESQYEEILKTCNETSPYGLTGSIFGQDHLAIEMATQALTHSAGNFYINNKPTGAVVGQQPFGGGRASGTNDKAGSLFNLLRWVSIRTISETFSPPSDYRYPYMG